MRVFQIGSSLVSKTPNDFDLLIVSDIPVDICLYSEAEWEKFIKNKGSNQGHRIVIYPKKQKSCPPMKELNN